MMQAEPTTADEAAHTRGALLRYAVLLTGNRDDAEDLLHEATAKVLARPDGGAGVTHAPAYLRRTLTTVFLDQRRRGDVWRRLLPVVGADARRDAVRAGPEDAVADRLDLARSLAALPHRQRAAVVLHFYDDLPFRDVAAALDCSDATARSLVSRGLARMRLTITADEEDEG